MSQYSQENKNYTAREIWKGLHKKEKAFTLGLSALVASELWFNTLSPAFMYILFLGAFWIPGFSLKNLKGEPKILVLLYVFYWGLHLVALLWTDNLSEGLAKLDIKSGLVFLPLTLVMIPLSTWKKWMPLLKRIYTSLLWITIILCMGRAAYLSLESGSVTGPHGFRFTYSSLSLFIMHPGYLSLYFCTGILWIGLDSKPWKIQKIVPVLSFAIFTFLLSSRGVILALVVAISVGLIYKALQLRSKKVITALIVLPLLLLLAIMVLPEKISGRYTQVFSSDQFKVEPGQTNYSSIQTRIVQWNSALEIIEKKPWLGVSPGDAQAQLREKYKEAEFAVGLKEGFNTHNVFLQDQLSLGIMASVFWLVFFISCNY